jgi:Tfp pilus assembly protein PilF
MKLRILQLLLAITLAAAPCVAETGYVTVLVQDAQQHPVHPSVATDLDNLAMLLWDKGDPAAAEPLLRRALAIDEKALGPNHPATRRVRKDLTDLQRNAATAHQ